MYRRAFLSRCRQNAISSCLPAFGFLLWASCVAVVHAAGGQQGEAQSGIGGIDTAAVVVDGREILTVRGIAAFPAERRAREIRKAIIAVAEDETIPSGAITLQEKDDRTDITAGERFLLDLFDEDAALDGVSRKVLAETAQLRLREAITDYRLDRTPRALTIKSLYALAATAVAVGLFFGFRKGFRSLDGVIERRLQDRLKALEAQSARFVKAQQIASALRGLTKALYLLLGALTLYFYLNFVLGLYPWTRGFAVWLFGLILDPLESMGAAALATVPDLVFLVILFFVTRYILRMIQAFFRSIDRGAVRLKSFERDWALPTYRILRLLVIIFAVVVAYPYIPGSESEAFKGISILLGLIVSLGSSSIIANIIAGYSMAYRRPFKVGDRVKINDTVGEVIEIRVLVTRLRSLKNEEVVIPNTTILSGEVVNYSTLAEQQGLILHTSVGIGYETPWRQVEAMLKRAASRTPRLLERPEPFVLRKELGDFAVVSELNAYCSDPANMARIYSALHDNILDVFNEYGVAIMTPSYMADPAEPKLVPKEQWYAAPAKPPSEPLPG
jgi:small-conductance mechanosensitive channel